jgi:hypothetical protein
MFCLFFRKLVSSNPAKQAARAVEDKPNLALPEFSMGEHKY